MAITTRNLSEAEYDAARYAFIKQVEEGGQVSLTGYVDTRGIPTIGLGFNLRTHLDTIMVAMGIRLGFAEEAQYESRLQSIVSRRTRTPLRGRRSCVMC